jgi:hypothetical protein
MLYYIEQFIREAPERFTVDNLDMVSASYSFLYLFSSCDAVSVELCKTV